MMIQLLLAAFPVLCGLGAGWCFCLAWQQSRRTSNTPVHIWPLAGTVQQQRWECLARAMEVYASKKHKAAGLSA